MDGDILAVLTDRLEKVAHLMALIRQDLLEIVEELKQRRGE